MQTPMVTGDRMRPMDKHNAPKAPKAGINAFKVESVKIELAAGFKAAL